SKVTFAKLVVSDSQIHPRNTRKRNCQSRRKTVRESPESTPIKAFISLVLLLGECSDFSCRRHQPPARYGCTIRGGRGPALSASRMGLRRGRMRLAFANFLCRTGTCDFQKRPLRRDGKTEARGSRARRNVVPSLHSY